MTSASNELSTLHKHSAIYLLGRVLPAIIGLFGTAIYTRLISPEQYSIYVVGLSSAQILNSLVFQWLRISILRYSQDQNSKEIQGVVLSFYLVQLLIFSFLSIGIICTLVISGANYEITIACATLLLAQAWFDMTQEMQRASLQPIEYSKSFATRTVLAVAMGTAALWLTGSGLALALATALAYLTAPLVYIRSLFAGIKLGLSNRDVIVRVLRYGAPLAVALLLNNVGVLGDRLLVQWFLGERSAGLYGPIAEITRQTIFMLLQSVTLATYPLALKALTSKGQAAAIDQMADNLALLLFVGIPTMVALCVMPNEIAQLLLGSAYHHTASELFPILSISTMMMCLSTFYYIQANQLGEKTSGQVWVAAITAVTSVAINIALLPRLGLTGAAWAACGAQALGLAAAIFVSKRTFPLIFPPSHAIRPILASLFMTSCVFLLRTLLPGEGPASAILVILVGGLAYAVAALVLNAAGIREIITNVVRKRIKVRT